MPAKKFFVYLLECSDGTFYCGCTANMKARLALHNKGKAAKYTRARKPVKLAYLESQPTKQQALKKEAKIKKLARKQKQKMIATYKHKI